jgi:hypothetical protein
MSDQTEVVEGQALARAVLEALDQERTPDWDALDRAYREPLLRVAAARLRRLGLHRHSTPEDVLHGFLAQRVYPPRRAREMFAPSAGGARPLRSRLMASLGNYCTDLTRSPAARRERGAPDDLLAHTPARPDDPLPAYEEVERLLGRQMRAIREGCPPRRRQHGAPYREALLLRLRLDWAGAFDGVELRSEAAGRPVSLTLALLEELTVWTDDERGAPLVEGGITLGQLWQQAREVVRASPGRPVSVERLVPLIPVSPDVWNQWISRGRRRVQSGLGADYPRVFALWAEAGEGA